MNYGDMIDAVEQEIDLNCNVMQDNPNIDAAQQIYCMGLVREFMLTHKVEVNKFLDNHNGEDE